ncbi:uncharacterized protein ARMOST_09165 [Armillaria ostoyae]|uniref:Uncharacterized protein n=1 Tax=Armillaria ostoyae TaxID=47428 RepID=A0A284RAR3_ARMOS|nr:uncharacterized protein ARMOST_09165 [Armillaria ostoyae]
MSSPIPRVLSDAHRQKRKRSHRAPTAPSAAVVPVVQSSAPFVGPPYTQVVYLDTVDAVRPSKKVRAYQPTHSVGSECGDGAPPVTLPSLRRGAFHHLPPVTISRPSGVGKHTLHRRVSYGDIGPDEVSAVCAPAGDDAALVAEPSDEGSADDRSGDCSDVSDDGSSGPVRGNMFVNDIASEVSDGSESASDVEGESGSDEYAHSEDAAAVLASVPSQDATSYVGSRNTVPELRVHASGATSSSSVSADTGLLSIRMSSYNKTERGRYVDTMIQNGLGDHVASSGRDHSNPSVVISPRKQSKAQSVPVTRVVDGSPVHVTPAQAILPVRVTTPVQTARVSDASAPPTVYLEDLDGPPLPASAKKPRRARGGGKPVPIVQPLPMHTDLHALGPAAGPTGHPVKTLVLSGTRARTCLLAFAAIVLTFVAAAHSTFDAFVSGTSEVTSIQPGSGGSVAVAQLGAAISIAAGSSAGTNAARSDVLLDALDAMLGCALSCADTACDEEEEDIGTEAVPVSVLTGADATGNSDDVPEPEDESQRVMLIELQEEQHIEYYRSLPGLGKHRAMVPLGQTDDAFDQPPFIMLDVIFELFNKDALRSVVAARMFYGYGQFCNLSTMPLSTFRQDGRKLICAARTAISMIVGLVVDSSLVKIGHLGGYNGSTAAQGGKLIHGIRILPFIQPWRRETSAIGAIFDLDLLHSENMCSDGIDFATRCDSLLKPESNTNRYTTPALVQSVITKNGSGSKTASPVPMFDGCASKGRHFLFQPDDFDWLASMPRVPTNRELDRFTLVAIGYTPTVWSPGQMAPRVSMNVVMPAACLSV